MQLLLAAIADQRGASSKITADLERSQLLGN